MCINRLIIIPNRLLPSINRALLVVLLFVSLTTKGFSENFQTFFADLTIEEPVLLELIHSPAFQRLKFIHQYGVAYYTTHREEYTRYDHSLGVFAILRIKGAPLEEQIAGLLHDVSHTVFSHVGDWVFGKEYQDADYQSTIHDQYLANSGIENILKRHGYTVEQMHPKRKEFAMLEQSLPNLSADRLDYNIQGAYFQNFLTKEESIELLQDLQFVEGKWLLTRVDLAAKLMHFSLYMTENCWGSAVNHVTSRWLADAILQGIQTGLISWQEFHFGIDEDIWNKLCATDEPLIVKRMHMLLHPEDYFRLVSHDQTPIHIKFRCRGIDPWILQGNTMKRLSKIDPQLAEAFNIVKENAARGWAIEMHQTPCGTHLQPSELVSSAQEVDTPSNSQ